MKRTAIFLFLTAVVLRLSFAAGDDQPPKNEKKFAPMPWHLVDTWWDIGQDTLFESLAVDVTISDDVPSSVNLYIARIGLPKVTVTFGPPIVNGTAPKNPTADAIYPKGVPDYADTVVKDGSLVITVGQPVEGREKRAVKLIENQK